MKTFLLLEPPFSTISLELEDAAEAKKYCFFSLSDIYMSEVVGEGTIAKKIKETKASGEPLPPHFAYRLIIEKYLKKPPKNTPNGFVLAPDCFGSVEELEILLEVLDQNENKIDAVIDIQISPEECASYLEDYQVDEAKGLAEIAKYFEVLYPPFLEILKKKGIRIEVFNSDEDAKTTFKRFSAML